MNKFLRYSLSLVLAFVASVTFAQEVTFDFAGNNWKLPDSKAQGITNATDFTNGTYTITVSAPEKAYYLASNNAIIYGKKDAYINLPKFDFDVERIDIISLLEDLVKLPETFLLVIKLSVHKQQVLKVHTSTKLLQTTRLPIRYIPSKLQMPTMTKSKKF